MAQQGKNFRKIKSETLFFIHKYSFKNILELYPIKRKSCVCVGGNFVGEKVFIFQMFVLFLLYACDKHIVGTRKTSGSLLFVR